MTSDLESNEIPGTGASDPACRVLAWFHFGTAAISVIVGLFFGGVLFLVPWEGSPPPSLFLAILFFLLIWPCLSIISGVWLIMGRKATRRAARISSTIVLLIGVVGITEATGITRFTTWLVDDREVSQEQQNQIDYFSDADQFESGDAADPPDDWAEPGTPDP